MLVYMYLLSVIWRYSVWSIWFISALWNSTSLLEFSIFWKECVIHAIFFPTPCSVFTHSGSHVPGNFLISHDRLIRYDHTFIYLVILIQVKGFQVILNITLKCPRFLNTVFLHCYSLQRGIIKASWAP